jgi:alkaline phosphatase
VVGLVDTRNAYGGLTDSAAGATAYATGTRTFNRAIAVAPECRVRMREDSVGVERDPASCAPLPTILEDAEKRGLSTGLVTTTAVTDASPASFAAHAPNRYLTATIAPQMLASGVDVLMGGGRTFFDGTSGSGAGDLLADVCHHADCPAGAAALASLSASDARLIGLFAAEEMQRAGARLPDLPTMTRVALDRLERDPDGFFLVVETEGTDSYQHDNDPLELITAEIVEFDRAVGVALDFAARVSGTLVVVTADHETGGLSILGEAGAPEAELAYTTGDHTHAMVPLFAAGPGAERLAGIRNNDEVGRILRELLLGEK